MGLPKFHLLENAMLSSWRASTAICNMKPENVLKCLILD